MSVHISAQKGDIAPVVLMPGDPLRAKYIADNWLTDPVLVSTTRNVFFYTGTYKGSRITVGASGMGCPSIGIYSYELYNEYDVECIIRIGTAGSYHAHIGLYELINVDVACSESTYAKVAFDYSEDCISHQGNAYDIINATATRMQQNIRKGHIHSSDVFYRKVPGMPAIVTKYDCMAVEMEAFSLFSNAKALGKTAATLLTISDVIPTHEEISADAREKSLKPMIELALESAVAIVGG
jgi:purine-nucleoside phosphorylase